MTNLSSIVARTLRARSREVARNICANNVFVKYIPPKGYQTHRGLFVPKGMFPEERVRFYRP